MATDITFSSLTNATTASNGTGYFDVLMKAISLHIEDQYTKGRLKGTDYATVYLGAMQSALAQAEEFLLQEKLIEAQVDGIAADNLLKAKQLEIAAEELILKTTEANRLKDLTEAELEKQWGYDVTRDVNDELVLGISTGVGKIDTETDVLQQKIVGRAQTPAI